MGGGETGRDEGRGMREEGDEGGVSLLCVHL